MRIFASLLLSLSVTVLSCSTTYYTKIFRVETAVPQPEYFDTPTELIDATLGSHMGWDWVVRAVSQYETNNTMCLQGDRYSFTVQQIARKKPVSGRPASKPAVDSLIISFVPTGDYRILKLQRSFVDSVSYGKTIRRIQRFGELEIPTDVDTILVQFTSGNGGGQTEEFTFRMVKFMGKHAKPGILPKDPDC